MSEVIVTKHAQGRFRERLGIKKGSCLALAEDAYLNGLHYQHTAGKLARYLTKLFRKYPQRANNIRILNRSIFVFSDNILITVLSVPPKLRKYADNCRS